MPRLSLRKLLFSVAILSCTVIILVNIHLRTSSPSEELVSDVPPERGEAAANFSSPEWLIRPWFMSHGAAPATYNPNLALWPEDDPDSDRIVNQLMYIPKDYEKTKASGKLKKILLFFGKGGWHDLPLGRTKFLQDRCPVDTCELTTNMDQAETADAIFFKDRFSWPNHRRPPHQVWILFLLECPLNTQGFSNLPHVFNWTATYRHDSDIVAPYEKFVLFPKQDKDESTAATRADFAEKTKNVAWFVSNCAARNHRLDYARMLMRHIQVDIFGTCGQKRCPRTQASKCFDLLNREYKFYLAFENSNCRDYITEKFFVNGLGQKVVPIVMGAHPYDYRRVAPPHSYIHVDEFASPRHVAEYLHMLDANDTLYHRYFDWKSSGEFINTYFWCRLCALLHAPRAQPKSYADIHSWWAGTGICTSKGWKYH